MGKHIKHYANKEAYRKSNAFRHIHGLSNPCGPNVVMLGAHKHLVKHTGKCKLR